MKPYFSKREARLRDAYSFSAPRPVVIGCFPKIDKELKNFYLYLYLYNPNKDYIKNATVNLSLNTSFDYERLYSKDYNSIQCSVLDSTEDNLYFKLRINLAAVNFDKYVLPANSFVFSWDKLTLGTSRNASLPIDKFNTYYQNNCYYVVMNSDGTSDVSFDQSEVAKLDVEYTSYTTSATDGWNTRDQIHTVYFSIPDEYSELYPDLDLEAGEPTRFRSFQ